MTLRETFDEAPELYDRVRPGYPAEVFDDLAALAGLRLGSRVLELGPGTGQARVPLARRGYEVTALELVAGLTRVARRKLAGFPMSGSSTPGSRLATARRAVRRGCRGGVVPLARRGSPPREGDRGGPARRRARGHLDAPRRRWRNAVLRRGPALLRAVDAGDVHRIAAGSAGRRADGSRGARGQPALERVAIRRYERDLSYSTRKYLALLAELLGSPSPGARSAACAPRLRRRTDRRRLRRPDREALRERAGGRVHADAAGAIGQAEDGSTPARRGERAAASGPGQHRPRGCRKARRGCAGGGAR